MKPGYQRNLDPALFTYPFDQHQRYRDIRVILDQIRTHSNDAPPNVLDVGGTLTAVEFLAGYPVTLVNPEAASDINLQSDGLRLPFPDNSFDVVITVDTLEHVPDKKRQTFVQELLRISRLYTIITGPFSNGYNEQAELILNDFLVEFLGIEHRFLSEHLQNGLPDVDTCLGWISTISDHYVVIPSGYLHHWLPLMIIKHYLSQLAQGATISKELDVLYNYQCYWSDHRLPSYRQIIVVAKKGQTEVLDKIENTFASSAESTQPDLNGVIAMWQALKGTHVFEERDNEIEKLRQDVEALQELVRGYQSGRFIRLMSVVHQIIGVFKK